MDTAQLEVGKLNFRMCEVIQMNKWLASGGKPSAYCILFAGNIITKKNFDSLEMAE